MGPSSSNGTAIHPVPAAAVAAPKLATTLAARACSCGPPPIRSALYTIVEQLHLSKLQTFASLARK
jgi:hypothetical protein